MCLRVCVRACLCCAFVCWIYPYYSLSCQLFTFNIWLM